MITSILGGVVFDSGDLASAASSISTGNILNGDKDGWYTIIIRHIGGAAGGSNCLFRLNNDSGANYGRKGIVASNTSVGDWSATGETYAVATNAENTHSGFYVGRLYAKSGSVRLINGFRVKDINGTTVTEIVPHGTVWNNTADNITNITFYVGTANHLGIGTRIIILKSDNFTESAWVRVGSQVLGAPASSVTFSGLDGDRDVLYYLSGSFLNAYAGANTLLLNFNADATNYGYQNLQALNTSLTAGRGTFTGVILAYANAQNEYGQFNQLIFAKQGFIRPCIGNRVMSVSGTTVTAIDAIAHSWNVTNTNLTQMVVSGASNGLAAGTQVDLYALRPLG